MTTEIKTLIDNLGLTRTRIRGPEIMASCPFSYTHTGGKDDKPSFSINIEKGVYNCFSCGERGTIEELVSRIKSISITGALALLESWGFDRLAIELGKEEVDVRPEILPEGLLYYFDKVEDDFAEIYKGDVDGQECIVYPVRNREGKLVGALARSVVGRWHKVMWNLPKKRYLYGEDRVELEQPLIIVEGPGDAIALRKSSLKNVVALMGSNISNEQIEKLLCISSNFIVWLDKDRAGAKGMNRLVQRLEKRATIRYVDPWKSLPDGANDPKDVFENYDTETVRNVVRSAKTLLEHIVEGD
jgi:DNA primase